MATADVTFEEAKRCPRCDTPGEETRSKKVKDGVVHVITCRNEKCRWFNTGWFVQVNSDGTIPQREQGPRGQDKDFAPMSPDQQANAKRFWEDQERFERGG